MLIDGKWSTQWYEPDEDGRFVRGQTRFRSSVSRCSSSEFPVESGRYHLYVSLACPWAHRTLLMRRLRKLEGVLGLSIVDPYMGEDGWCFSEMLPEPLYGARCLRELYTRAQEDYTGRVTVPVLWDRKQETIVNNESREIMRMLDVEFAEYGDSSVSFLPTGKAKDVDTLIAAIYEPINNGVYRAGFATTQTAYEEAVAELFAALDHYDRRLGQQRYLLGNTITEADWCLFTTLFRFDPVYHYHFKCNQRRLRDYPNLWGYVCDLYQVPGVRETCNLEHIKRHYFCSHEGINPQRIVPVGPEIDYDAPHERGRFE